MKKNILFADSKGRKRYLCTLLMILLMVGTAELLEEKEILFPEMAALTIGMWIVDKRVWKANRIHIIVLMTLGAIAGVGIVRYLPLPLLLNLGIAFSFAALCLMLTRTTLIPLLSACMLPVLLKTESWIYPLAVCIMSLFVVSGQLLMEKYRLRRTITYIPSQTNRKKECIRWALLLLSILLVAVPAVYSSNVYCILPPLIVTYVEFVNSKAGFRNRPVQIFLLLVFASLLGSGFQWLGHICLHLPESVTALLIFVCLFIVFEWMGKYFAPAGALALIPMIIPPTNLIGLPVQVALGAALFISIAMIFFHQCYKWPKSQLIVCLVPSFFRKHINRTRFR